LRLGEIKPAYISWAFINGSGNNGTTATNRIGLLISTACGVMARDWAAADAYNSNSIACVCVSWLLQRRPRGRIRCQSAPKFDPRIASSEDVTFA
jgi:hypothetical protein